MNDLAQSEEDGKMQTLAECANGLCGIISEGQGIFFTFFVLLQFWNIFNARYFRTGRSLIEDLIDMVKHPSSISRHYSTGFVSIIFVILIGQIMITNVFGEMFGVEALSIKDWLFLFVTTSPVLLIGDTLRLLKNKIS